MLAGIISDTHGSISPRVLDFLNDVDEIWHAGDIGTPVLLQSLQDFKPVRAVSGNIDGQDIRLLCKPVEQFEAESVRVLMTHIGGYPGRYPPGIARIIESQRPNLFISGHSHILKVMYDKRYRLLHINPGAAGNSGMHRSVTAVKLVIDGEKMHDLRVFDLPRNRF